MKKRDLSSPVDLALLRSVDLGDLDTLAKEKDLHLIEQKLMSIRI